VFSDARVSPDSIIGFPEKGLNSSGTELVSTSELPVFSGSLITTNLGNVSAGVVFSSLTVFTSRKLSTLKEPLLSLYLGIM
jgi:uncharacterized membrane protein YqgA involved in biofilm formation